MSELKTRVEELKMENEYQLRLKDMNYNEKIKELTEKFIQVSKHWTDSLMNDLFCFNLKRDVCVKC